MTTCFIIVVCIFVAAVMLICVSALYKQHKLVMTFQCECVGNTKPRLGFTIHVHRDGTIDAVVIYGESIIEYDLPSVGEGKIKRDLVATNAVIDLEHRLHHDYAELWPELYDVFNATACKEYYVTVGKSDRKKFRQYKDARVYADVEVRQYLQLS